MITALTRAKEHIFLWQHVQAHKQRVRIVGLKAKPEHNGAVGRATMFDREAQRYAVELEGGGATLKVKEANLELAAPEAGVAV